MEFERTSFKFLWYQLCKDWESLANLFKRIPSSFLFECYLIPSITIMLYIGFYGSNLIRISSLRTTFSKTKHTYTREKTEKKEPPRQSSVRRAAHAKFFLVVSKRRIEEAFLRWNENMQQCFQSAVPFVFFFSRLIMCVSYFHWCCTGFALCLSLLSLAMPRFMLRFDFWKPHLDNGEHRLHLLNTHHSLPTLFI